MHVLVELPPNLELSRFVNNGRRGVYRKPVFWSRASCIKTCGAAIDVLKHYMEQQATPE